MVSNCIVLPDSKQNNYRLMTEHRGVSETNRLSVGRGNVDLVLIQIIHEPLNRLLDARNLLFHLFGIASELLSIRVSSLGLCESSSSVAKITLLVRLLRRLLYFQMFKD